MELTRCSVENPIACRKLALDLPETDPPPRDVLRLTQVCRHWQWVAHTTPQLWTRLSIPPWAIPYGQFVFTLLPFVHRISSLNIQNGSCSSELALRLLFASPLEALETLHLCDESLPSTSVDLCAVAPRLRRLFLYYVSDVFAFFDKVPWAQLTHLRLDYHYPGESLEIMRQCGNLEEAEIWILEDADEPILTNEPITFHHLHCLKLVIDIVHNETGRFPCFFRPLTLPALTSLEISFNGPQWPPTLWSADEFSEFQLRTPNIQFLTLTHCALNSEELIIILQFLVLFSTQKCIDDAFLLALRYDESSSTQPLVPLLKSFSWEEIGKNFEEASLEGMIRSRWWPPQKVPPVSVRKVARLKCGLLRCSEHHLSDGFRARMQDCAQYGIDMQ
ncbi:hypothetical protein C8J57DRAFT_1286826 [Mycena rebaudengoi]|nr:hypothetical protein C8J57DRAFT_1286826 [Mycena rebaudengoi]